MRRLEPSPRRPFQRLRWQLTLRYMATTCLATILLEGTIFALLIAIVLGAPALPGALQRRLAAAAVRLTPLLAPPVPDRAKADVWLQTLSVNLSSIAGVVLEFSTRDDGARAAVVDSRGRVVSAIPPSVFPVGGSLAEHLPSRDQDLVTAALAGEWDTRKLSRRAIDLSLSAVAPVRDAAGRVRGAAYYRIQPLHDDGAGTRAFFTAMVNSALLVGVFSGISGALAGFLTARRLTVRLGAIEAAADSWAEGDFAARAPEAGDELGVLAARLNRMAAELRDLLSLRQDVATLEERQRLARDLHDTVKQQVFATAMQVGAARALLARDPAAAQERLDVANELAHQAQQELTAVLSALRPVSPGLGTLPELLRSHATAWSRRTGIVLTLAVDDAPAVSETIANALLRIAQEALANVERHAGATRVTVSVTCGDDSTLRLAIRDDGVGFVPDRVSRRADGGGLGLATMRERAEALPGGALAVLSAPGAGTVVQVSVPLDTPQ